MPRSSHDCPALFISAPASGQGKTTVTAALARWHQRQGRKVRVFKTGPDYLDPKVLEVACGSPVYQLDLWMAGAENCQKLLFDAALEADLILIEGVMGLYDGSDSSAALAMQFGIPIMAVIDGSAMAQTFGALALGLSSYQPDLPFAGVFANRVGSQAHGEMLKESLPNGMRYFGQLARQQSNWLPERHLGLLQPEEIGDIDTRIDAIADAFEDALEGRQTELPKAVRFSAPVSNQAPNPESNNCNDEKKLVGKRIGIARDAAFSFLYPANIDVLKALGAEVVYFSPLNDPNLPTVDALYFPGGYPELYLQKLSSNAAMQTAIRAHHADAKPIFAECGGMLYLLNSLSDGNGNRADMVGLLPGHGELQPRLMNIGMHSAQLPEGTIRGHSFHHSSVNIDLAPLVKTHTRRHHGQPETIYRQGRLTATYMHFYFGSNPNAVASLFSGYDLHSTVAA